jgi:parallel beta-helix repeat protein
MERIMKILSLSQLCLAFLVFAFALPVWGATYYVKSGGNDLLAGTSDGTAWETISKVEATVTNGDTVYFRSQDTWTVGGGGYTDGAGYDALLYATAGVTYDGSTYGSGTRATFQATERLTRSGIITIHASNVTVRGFVIDGNEEIAAGIGVGGSSDISTIIIDDCIIHDINGAGQAHYGIWIGTTTLNTTVSNVTLTDTTVYNVPYEGIAVYSGWGQAGTVVDTALVSGCTVYNTGEIAYGIGIMVGNGTTDITIEDNTVYNNSSQGIYVGLSGSSYTGEPTNIIVRSNKAYSNNIGLSIATGSTGTFINASADIYNNFFFNNTTSVVLGGGNYGTSTFNIYNNTFYSTASGSAGSISISDSTTHITGTPTIDFKNNIVYTTARPCYTECWNDGSSNCVEHTTHSNNLLYRSSGSADAHIVLHKYGSGEVTYNRAGVTTWEATAQNTDPLFVGVGNNDYRVMLGSDAINNGADLSAYFTKDYYGNTRPTGPGFDIGAHEYQQHAPSAPKNLRVVDP